MDIEPDAAEQQRAAEYLRTTDDVPCPGRDEKLTIRARLAGHTSTA